MNNFDNDGSFLEKFRNAQGAKTLEAQHGLCAQSQRSQHDGLIRINVDDTKKQPTFVMKAKLGASLSQQLAVGKLGSSAASKVVPKKPSIFDDAFDSEVDLDPKTKEAIENLAKSVAAFGNEAEESEKTRNKTNPLFWFLYDKESEAYKFYVRSVEEQRKLLPKPNIKNKKNCEIASSNNSNHCEIASANNSNSRILTKPISAKTFDPVIKDERRFESVICAIPFDPPKIKAETFDKSSTSGATTSLNPRKRKSRWDNSPLLNMVEASSVAIETQSLWKPALTPPTPSHFMQSFHPIQQPICAIKVEPCSESEPSTSSMACSINPEDQLDLFRKQILASQLAAKALARAARAKEGITQVHEYDSDEETEGGTWEHKKRMQEMEKTKMQAVELTERAAGKHHLGDFLPPEEHDKFFAALQKSKEPTSSGQPIAKSDYEENKLMEDNVGFKLLQKMGWSQGKGLGAAEQGIIAPVNKGRAPNDTQGLGAESAATSPDGEDGLFDVYRKRMMLAYKFRPNPLNNPRRPYY